VRSWHAVERSRLPPQAGAGKRDSFDHFFHVLDGAHWSRRIRGLRCNASRLSHAELDACEVLDDGDPQEIGAQYGTILKKMPWLNVFGGCCGSDLRHIKQIARAISTARPNNPRE
jgi:homocysteine S-methyltransferase